MRGNVFYWKVYSHQILQFLIFRLRFEKRVSFTFIFVLPILLILNLYFIVFIRRATIIKSILRTSLRLIYRLFLISLSIIITFFCASSWYLTGILNILIFFLIFCIFLSFFYIWISILILLFIINFKTWKILIIWIVVFLETSFASKLFFDFLWSCRILLAWIV